MQARTWPQLAHRTTDFGYTAVLLWLAFLASCDGCTERNPNVCCTSDSECAQLGLPPGSVNEYSSCGPGRVCHDFSCVSEQAPDASVDARPVVENGQRADLVLGQEIFTTADENHGGLSARSLGYPAGVTVDEVGRLWVLDFSNHRALMWSPTPPVSFAAASLVVGSTSFTSVGSSCSGPTTFLADFAQLAAMDGKLVIPSAGCQRVMIWNPTPITNGAAASIALGQSSFNESTSGNGAADLNLPGGVWTDGTRVVVADTGNHRVLIWTSFPTTNKQPADIVLGQPGFGTSGFPSTPTGATMRSPVSVYSDGSRLFVADSQNARVLVWRSFPTTSSQPADLAIGQADLTSSGIGRGASQLGFPVGVTTVGDHLFVADSSNNRVLVFSPIPISSGASASYVLGQPGFETTNAGTTPETLRQPTSLVVSGSKLYVADLGNHRVLRFALKL